MHAKLSVGHAIPTTNERQFDLLRHSAGAWADSFDSERENASPTFFTVRGRPTEPLQPVSVAIGQSKSNALISLFALGNAAGHTTSTLSGDCRDVAGAKPVGHHEHQHIFKSRPH